MGLEVLTINKERQYLP